MDLRGKTGSIRFFGKLRNNPRAGDALWLGIEWDEMGSGKHNGTVDGEVYFGCEFHVTTAEFATGTTQCCSFIRYGKIDIGGVSFAEAILLRYKPDNMKTEEEARQLAQALVGSHARPSMRIMLRARIFHPSLYNIYNNTY